jgi:phosphoglycolate phosphatase-like HAD superfamily hydrolase
MLEKAIGRFNLNAKECIMIGDKERDVTAAAGAGVTGFLVPSNPTLIELMNCLPA